MAELLIRSYAGNTPVFIMNEDLIYIPAMFAEKCAFSGQG
jgi:hypothetical protein